MGNYCIASIPTPDGIINNRDREYSMQTYESFQSWVREYTIYDWVNFYSQIWTCKILGFLSYLCGLFPDSVQTTEGTQQWLLHLHAKLLPVPSIGLPCRQAWQIFNLFFMLKIDHNFINLYWIPTKIATEMCFNEPFMCTKFELNRCMRSHFIWPNCEMCEKTKKNKKEKTK